MAISWIAFACLFGGAVFGMLLRRILPERHLSADSKDVVKLGMGLIATMSALVLGLLIASAKGSYDTQRSEVTQMSADIVQLVRVLAHYGP
jgi:cytosine/uracil/thiamine/allantoin permease